MDFTSNVDIEAPRERVWEVLSDVARWPEWTASMQRVRYVAGEHLVPGSRVQIQQPRMPVLVWDVTEVTPLESFTWITQSSGLTTQATHQIRERSAGGVTVTLGIRQSGGMAWLVGLLTGRLIRRYVRMEADGLKRRCEARV
jgi:uncharacterized protein YndB with AHSA1/START domain